MNPPPQIILRELAERPVSDHGIFLRSLLAYAAAGLVNVEGETSASMTLYKLADLICTRGQ